MVHHQLRYCSDGYLVPDAELLNGEIFCTLREAQVLIESWRCHYNAMRSHGSLGYRPPAPETIVMPSWPPGSAPPATQLGRETSIAPTFQLDQSTGGRSRPTAVLPVPGASSFYPHLFVPNSVPVKESRAA